MIHYRISMTQEGGRELYGQGRTLTEALTGLLDAANEFETSPADGASLAQGLAELQEALLRARRKVARLQLKHRPNPLGAKPGA